MNLQIIFGIIGNILSFYFGIKILQTYNENRIKVVKPLNDYLFFIMFFNSFNWLYYSVVLNDIFIFINNILFIYVNLGMMLICYSKLDDSRKKYIELISGLFISYFLIMTFLFNFTSISYSDLVFIFGFGLVISSIGSYLAPIFIIKEVIQTQNHKLIYIPQALIGLVTMIIFLTYGIIINNIFIVIVDAIVIFICIIQLLVYLYYKFNKNQVDNLDKVNTVELTQIKPSDSELIVKSDDINEIIV
jgi:solute carrier family 50 protein (sugar transporter)